MEINPLLEQHKLEMKKYTDFLSRWQDAIDRAVSQPEVRELLLKTLACENANSECQKAVKLLKTQNTSLDEYICACMDIETISYQASVLAAALKRTLNLSHQVLMARSTEDWQAQAPSWKQRRTRQQFTSSQKSSGCAVTLQVSLSIFSWTQELILRSHKNSQVHSLPTIP